MQKELTIRKAQEDVTSFLKKRKWFPNNSLGRYYTLGHAMEELGEIARYITNLESKRSEIKGISKEDLLKKLELEIGDLMYHVLKFGCAYNIDVNDAFMKAMKKMKKKFSIERFKSFKQF